MTCKEIIAAYLRENKFDGIYNSSADCACLFDDLMLCDSFCGECEPGYKVPCDCGDHDYHIDAKKENVAGDDP